MRRWWGGRLGVTLLDLLYPRTCLGCGGTAEPDGGQVCWDCLLRLKRIVRPFCEVCGDPADGDFDRSYECSWCRSDRPGFERARSAVRYRDSVRELIHALKYGDLPAVVPDLVNLLDATVRAWYANVSFDVVCAVPLHAIRERERGYNQSHLLALELAGRLSSCPPVVRALTRHRETVSQTGLTAAKRRMNVADAFECACPRAVKGRTVLLIDDVMTTGATVRECAHVLVEAGAAAVYVLTVARG